MGSQASVNTNDKEQQLKKASKMSLIRSLLPCMLGFKVQHSACNPCRYCVRSIDRSNQRLLLCIP